MMTTMRATISALVGLAGCVVLPAAPATAQTLSAAEVREAMLGKTIRTRRFGLPITMEYRPDGTVTASAPLGTIEGTWRAEGNGICTTFPSGPAEGTQCVTFERTGPNRFRNSDGVVFTVD